MGLGMIFRVCRHWTFSPLGHQCYRLGSYNKDPPLHNGYNEASVRIHQVQTHCR